jgi:hypothetical protein
LHQKNKFSNLAGYTPLKYLFSGKPLITPEPRIGKFQKLVEMKVDYPTDKGNIGGFGWIDQSGASIKTTFLICRTFHRYIPISSANYNILQDNFTNQFSMQS